MKKVLFLVSLIAAPLFAANASDNLIKGLELVKNHKAEWFKYEKEFHDAKYKLIEAEHNKMFDQKINAIKQSTGNLEDYKQSMLTNLLASHTANMKAWHDMCKSFHEKAKSIYERHMKEIEKLDAIVNPKAEEPEMEEVEVEEVELE